MNSFRYFIFFALSLLLTQSFSKASSYSSSAAAAVEADPFLQSVQTQIDKKLIPGAVVVTLQDSNFKFYTYGETQLKNKTKPDADTIFEIGSITKVFAGIILADLHIKKIVNLNDPISKYIPELAQLPAGSIKLVELSTHMSGLPRLPENFKPQYNDDPYADYDEQTLLNYLKSVKQLKKPSGFSWDNYSNLAVGLLGYSLERATKKTFAELLKEIVTGPLKMDSTALSLNDSLRARLATPYNDYLQATKNWSFQVLAAAGGIKSSARDLSVFMLANLEPQKTSLAEALKLAQQIQVSNGQDSIGLGWAVDSRFIGHNGGTGGYRSDLFFSLSEKRGQITLVNSANGLQCAKRIFITAENCTHQIGFELSDAELLERAGTYTAPEINLTFVIEKHEGFLTYEIPNQEKGRLFAESKNLFDIKKVAKMEFIEDAQSRKINKMKFTQKSFSIELKKQ